MGLNNILLSCAWVTAALALPTPQENPTTGFDPNGPYAHNTTISYFTGLGGGAGINLGSFAEDTSSSMSPLDRCGYAIGKGVLQSLRCTALTNSGIGIEQQARGSCSFTLYAGTEHCDVLSDGSNKHEIAIPTGDEITCISTGVLDGGRFQRASGVWACG